MPDGATRFLRLSDVEIDWYARVPDEVAGDNIMVSGGCAYEEAYAHSYKLAWDRTADTFEHLTGSVPTVLAQTAREARNAVREGEFDQAREILAKAMCHYAVDATTIWHLTRELSGEQHKIGEEDTAKIAERALVVPVKPLKLANPKSLYESTVAACEETVHTQLDRVAAAQVHTHMSDKDLMAEMVNRCASFGLAVFLYAWHYVEKA